MQLYLFKSQDGELVCFMSNIGYFQRMECAELDILSLFVVRKDPEKGSEKTLRLNGN